MQRPLPAFREMSVDAIVAEFLQVKATRTDHDSVLSAEEYKASGAVQAIAAASRAWTTSAPRS